MIDFNYISDYVYNNSQLRFAWVAYCAVNAAFTSVDGKRRMPYLHIHLFRSIFMNVVC